MASFSTYFKVAAAVAMVPAVMAASETCSNPQLSCHTSPTPSNTCCYETQGLIQQVQFWDTNPSTGPSDSWTIHGLWPNSCSGSYQENCDESRAYKNITQILQKYGDSSTLDFMQTYWISDDESNEDFWEHEWETHGTCYSTLSTSCYSNYEPGQEAADYFNTAVSLFQSLDTYTILANAGITPSSSKEYSLSSMNSALEDAFGAPVILSCDSSTVYEIYYGFNVKGSVQDGTFEPSSQAGQSSNCPSTVKYPPKN